MRCLRDSSVSPSFRASPAIDASISRNVPVAVETSMFAPTVCITCASSVYMYASRSTNMPSGEDGSRLIEAPNTSVKLVAMAWRISR